MCGQLRAVKPLGQFEQCRVAAGVNVLKNDPRPLLDHRVKQAALRRQRAQFAGKRFVSVVENVHGAAKLEEAVGKVKTCGLPGCVFFALV